MLDCPERVGIAFVCDAAFRQENRIPEVKKMGRGKPRPGA